MKSLVFLVGALLPAPRAAAIEAVLAATWEPTFCQTAAGRGKAECKSETADRRDATHLSLHGLWPDDLDNKAIFPCYCATGTPVSCQTRGATDRNMRLSEQVWDRLRSVMPGTMSRLHLYEWSKHGTCYVGESAGAQADPEEFFSDAATLIEKLDASAVGELFRSKLGQIVTRDEIGAAFDQAFGAGASERVTVTCSGRGANAMIAELRINISGDITPDTDLGAIVLAAPTTETSTDTRGCRSGRIVQVE